MNTISPTESVRQALEVFVITLKVCDAINSGRWTADALKEHVTYKGEKESLWVPIHHHEVTQEGLKSWGDAVLYYSSIMLAIAADEALNRHFGNQPLEEPDLQRRAARCIVYMIRCTGAHQPIRPIWVCKGPYNQVFEVPYLNVRLDCPSVDGQPVKASDFGGWSKLKMLVEFCMQGVS